MDFQQGGRNNVVILYNYIYGFYYLAPLPASNNLMDLDLPLRYDRSHPPRLQTSFHEIDGHFVFDEVDGGHSYQRRPYEVPPRLWTSFHEIDHHLVVDEVDAGTFEFTEHNPPVTRTIYDDDSLSEEIISRFLKLSQVISSNENILCSICQEPFTNDEKAGRLDCGHEFHFGCIKHWLMIRNNCPNCRATGLLTSL